MYQSLIIVIGSLLVSTTMGCRTTSGESQQKALGHQQSSDEAAKDGAYGRAGAEQRKAHDAHHDAVNASIDEGNPIPPQTKPGDVPAPAPR